MNKEALLELVDELQNQLTDEWGEIAELRRENYQLKLKNKGLQKEWLQMLNANVNLANIIKSFDSEYFERVEVEKEGNSDYKGM